VSVESLLKKHSAALGLQSKYSVSKAIEIYRRARVDSGVLKAAASATKTTAHNPATQAGAVALAYRASFVPADEGPTVMSLHRAVGSRRNALVVSMAKSISVAVRVGKCAVLNCYREILEPRMCHLLQGEQGLGGHGVSTAKGQLRGSGYAATAYHPTVVVGQKRKAGEPLKTARGGGGHFRKEGVQADGRDGPSKAGGNDADLSLSALEAFACQKEDEKRKEEESTEEEEEEEEGELQKRVQVNTRRCWTCCKKIGLTGFKCKCGYVYCGTHRYENAHECDFNFVTPKKHQLEDSLPAITTDKMKRI
jgi:hypothetical protein